MTDMVTTLLSVANMLYTAVLCRNLLAKTRRKANMYLWPLIRLLQSEAVKAAVCANHLRRDVQLAVSGLCGAASELSTKMATMGRRSYIMQNMRATFDLQLLQSLLADLDRHTQHLVLLLGLHHSAAAQELDSKLHGMQGSLDALEQLLRQHLPQAASWHGQRSPLVQELQEEVSALHDPAAVQHLLAEAKRGVTSTIPRLVRLLDSLDTAVQCGAAGALGHLALDNAVNKASIASAGAIPRLVHMLGSSDTAVQREAASALGHVAADNPVNKASVARAGAIPPLVRLLGSPGVQPDAAWTLGILADGNAANKASITSAGGIPRLEHLARHSSVAHTRVLAGNALKPLYRT